MRKTMKNIATLVLAALLPLGISTTAEAAAKLTKKTCYRANGNKVLVTSKKTCVQLGMLSKSPVSAAPVTAPTPTIPFNGWANSALPRLSVRSPLKCPDGSDCVGFYLQTGTSTIAIAANCQTSQVWGKIIPATDIGTVSTASLLKTPLDAESIALICNTPAPAPAPATTAPAPAPVATAPAPAPVTAPANSLTLPQQQAVKKASDYLRVSAFSRQGLIDQLVYAGFSAADAAVGVDANNVDWNAQAIKKAADYLRVSAFSRQGLVDQLVFAKFTPEQAVYGVDSTPVDWNDQAAKKAAAYMKVSSFSAKSLYDQLVFVKFTPQQAAHGVRAVGFTWP
jgi:hypothetical protein